MKKRTRKKISRISAVVASAVLLYGIYAVLPAVVDTQPIRTADWRIVLRW